MASGWTQAFSEEDRLALRQALKQSSDWRARERAKTLLLLGQSLLCRQVALVEDLNICTVGQTWRRWRQEGMACLRDKPRKLGEAAAQRLRQWPGEKLARAATAPHGCEGRTGPCRYLHPVLEEGGLVCTRTRHSLKKKDAVAFERSRQKIEDLRNQAQASEIDLACVDEAGLKQVHPNRSAWTPCGRATLDQGPARAAPQRDGCVV